MRASFLPGLLGVVGFLSLCLAPVASAQEKSPYVLYSGINANFLSLWLAKEARYFTDEGLDVTAVHVRGAAPVVQNLIAGQSQIGMIGATVVATVALQGNRDIVMIGGVTNVMSAVIAARPGIDSPPTIRGKKLAIARFGGTSDFIVELRAKTVEDSAHRSLDPPDRQ